MSFDAESLKTYVLYAAVIAAIGLAIYMVVRFLKKDRYEYEEDDSEQFLGLFGNEKYDDEDSDEEDSDEEEGFDDSDSDEDTDD